MGGEATAGEGRGVPWAWLIGGVALAGITLLFVLSKPARREAREALGIPGPHESTIGWSEQLDERKELARFDGRWEPQAPDEKGCTWSVSGGLVDQRCGETVKKLRLELAGPAKLLVRDGGSQKTYGYARIANRLHVGPATTGMRVGKTIILDDSQERVVFAGGSCQSWRAFLVLGGGGPDWEHEPVGIECHLSDNRFDYQTVGYMVGRGQPGGLQWITTHVEVDGDWLYTKNLEAWPLLPMAAP